MISLSRKESDLRIGNPPSQSVKKPFCLPVCMLNLSDTWNANLFFLGTEDLYSSLLAWRCDDITNLLPGRSADLRKKWPLFPSTLIKLVVLVNVEVSVQLNIRQQWGTCSLAGGQNYEISKYYKLCLDNVHKRPFNSVLSFILIGY